jgi:hypothetical protein
MSVRACLALGLVLEIGSAAFAADYQAAKDLYDQGEIARARSGFSAVLDDSRQNAKDRAAAARALARIDWLIEGDANSASAHLAQALVLKSDECETRTYLVRVLRESGRAANAVKAAGDLESCADRPMRDGLLAERAHAALAVKNLDAAERSLRQISALGALAPPVNALKVEARLLRGDGAGALQAWRDYYWLTSSEAPPAFAKEPVRAIFHAGGSKGATAHHECRLLDLLTRAGFDEAARSFQADRALDRRGAREPLCRKAAIYLDFRSSLSAYLLAQNRKMAWMSISDKPAMQKIADDMGEYLTTLVQHTAAKLQEIGPQPKDDGPVGIVTDAFNLGSTFGFTSGYPSVHLGHVILDETRKVQQYGSSAQLNFRVYDPMISNGFQSWLWDGEKQTGGWGSTGAIVQIRAPYALSTIRWTGVATDPSTRRRAETDAREHSSGDLALLAQAQAAGKKVVYLPGLADRLELQSIDQIRASLGRVSKNDVPRHFAARESELTTRHSIWIHEGRHVLDGKYLKDKNFSQGELEYRAKLAEILLAKYPRMAFGSINDSLVNSDTSHGEANTRIMAAYADWIATHANEVRGYDASAPALTQVDKLTDAQLRTVASGLADFRKGER